MIRIISIVSNIALLLWVLYMVADVGLPKRGDQVIGALLIVVSASLSLISLNMNKVELDVMRKILDIWPFLLFKRLALEERKKIRDLREN